jgi:hypothetical protein
MDKCRRVLQASCIAAGAIDYLRVEHSALLDSQRVEILLACSGLKEEDDPPT